MAIIQNISTPIRTSCQGSTNSRLCSSSHARTTMPQAASKSLKLKYDYLILWLCLLSNGIWQPFLQKAYNLWQNVCCSSLSPSVYKFSSPWTLKRIFFSSIIHILPSTSSGTLSYYNALHSTTFQFGLIGQGRQTIYSILYIHEATLAENY